MLKSEKYIIKTELIGTKYKRKKKINPIISIGILSFYRFESTKHCIDSIMKAFKPCEFEIIILDNNSDLKTKEQLKKLAMENDYISLIFSPHNLGVGRGRNVLADNSKGKYILFLDNDCTISKNFISSLYYELEKNKKLGVMFGKIIENNQIITTGRKIVLVRNRRTLDLSDDKLFLSDSRGFENRTDVELGPGGATIFRSEILEDVRFDSNFFHHEDWDLMLSIKEKGYLIGYCPLATMFHYPNFDVNTEHGKVRRNMNNIVSSDDALRQKWNIERI